MEYLCIMCIIISVPCLKMPCLDMTPPYWNDRKPTAEQESWNEACFSDGEMRCNGIYTGWKEILCTGLLPSETYSVIMGAVLALLLALVGFLIYKAVSKVKILKKIIVL